jgi:hypothetical protein
MERNGTYYPISADIILSFCEYEITGDESNCHNKPCS